MSDFISAEGIFFRFADGVRAFQGLNCYFLAYCSDASRREAMATAKRMGAEVLRCWAFLDVDDFLPGQVAFQYFDGQRVVINDGPNGLQRLDALIQAAEDFGIKLILPLVNYWKDLGGMPAYVRWLLPGAATTEFYRSPVLWLAYQQWVSALLTRRNTRTGRLYIDEPAIFAWELTNEARCPAPDGQQVLLHWVGQMSSFVKSLDGNHLLALGDEGFFSKKGPGHLYDGNYGVDWKAILAIPEIDFGTFHFYPQDWGYEKNLKFAKRWINDHCATGKALNKPVVLEEFGLKQAPSLDRHAWFEMWNRWAIESGVAGTLLWMLGHDAQDTCNYKDDYVIYEASGQGSVTPE